jgi:hypothetical protein
VLAATGLRHLAALVGTARRPASGAAGTDALEAVSGDIVSQRVTTTQLVEVGGTLNLVTALLLRAGLSLTVIREDGRVVGLEFVEVRHATREVRAALAIWHTALGIDTRGCGTHLSGSGGSLSNQRNETRGAGEGKVQTALIEKTALLGHANLRSAIVVVIIARHGNGVRRAGAWEFETTRFVTLTALIVLSVAWVSRTIHVGIVLEVLGLARH